MLPLSSDRRESAPVRISRDQPISAQIGADQRGLAQIGADRRGSARIGADWRGSARIGADRRGSARPRPESEGLTERLRMQYEEASSKDKTYVPLEGLFHETMFEPEADQARRAPPPARISLYNQPFNHNQPFGCPWMRCVDSSNSEV